MKQYTDALQYVLEHGTDKTDRTGTGTRSIFGYQMRFNLEVGFPILTTKEIHWKSVAYELLWFLRGNINKKYLNDNGVRIWDEWADENGDLGPIYGKQWRRWGTADGKEIDQIKWLINEIKTNPDSRRLIVSAWNVGEIDKMKLPPCHSFFQFYVSDGKLSCHLYQRSADLFLGVPFNIASYALLTHIIAEITGLKVGDFVHSFGDIHIYKNHFNAVETLLKRKEFPLPTLHFRNDIKHGIIDDIDFDDFYLKGYKFHPKISAKVAV